MPPTNVPLSVAFSLPTGLESPMSRTSMSYERELTEHRRTESWLRKARAQDRALLLEKGEVINQQELLVHECHHRLLNSLQMIVSLLSLQSRTEENPEAAARLSVAANRVAAVTGLHRQLQSMASTETVEFKRYLDELCRSHSMMSTSEERPGQHIVVESIELRLPTATGIPLGLIANELVTNAIKHGKGRITVKLAQSGQGHALSVCNEGSTLPEGFDPAACAGLGMSLVSSLAQQIEGELRIDAGDENEITRFTVLFK
ncbi:MAG: sensor histidine kinase [Reyranella sp.]|nr:sensor histidine kinase [Reyranella sp.]